VPNVPGLVNSLTGHSAKGYDQDLTLLQVMANACELLAMNLAKCGSWGHFDAQER
jgi:hypothetical protein